MTHGLTLKILFSLCGMTFLEVDVFLQTPLQKIQACTNSLQNTANILQTVTVLFVNLHNHWCFKTYRGILLVFAPTHKILDISSRWSSLKPQNHLSDQKICTLLLIPKSMRSDIHK